MESRRARVGSTCIKAYGPRFKMVENPAWVRWNRELIAARAEQAQRQAEAHVAHERDLAAYQRALRDWEAERVSPAGEARRRPSW